MIEILGLIGIAYGVWMGVKKALIRRRARQAYEREAWKQEVAKSKPTPKRRTARINISEDAPTQMTQSELEAMGRWFKE